MKKKLLRGGMVLLLSLLLTVPVGAAYLLRAEDGLLTARDTETGRLVCQTETPLSALPEQDRIALTLGLILPDQTALSRALEDFCS